MLASSRCQAGHGREVVEALGVGQHGGGGAGEAVAAVARHIGLRLTDDDDPGHGLVLQPLPGVALVGLGTGGQLR